MSTGHEQVRVSPPIRTSRPRRPRGTAQLPRGAGAALEKGVRGAMEARFAHDFSRVRVHTDTEAGRFATGMGAAAATLEHDVWFGPGRYQPATAAGTHLLAHELAHVVQTSDASPEPARVAAASSPA